ncbi:MAG: hypothetical protein VX755_01665 [Pseudomonadota bacterium]|nr:hypothetical protein [Pseudomonadota bacterium]
MARKPKAADAAPVSAIKGFNADLTCRGFQFEVGKTYTHTGKVKACEGGFHAIIGDAHPLSVFEYYAPAGSRFCRVTLSGATDTDDNVKVAGEILKVGEEIGLRDLTLEAVKWVMDRATLEGPVATKPNGLATASGYQGAATASGDQGAATASGTQGAATASGTRGAATASGTRGAATASGYQGAATASGYQGAAMAPGKDGRVMGAHGVALFAVERGDWDGRGYPALSTASGIVGQDGIKPDTWYRAEAGKLVEA